MSEREEIGTLLKALSYYEGKSDDKVGSTTRKAMEAIQQRNGLQPDGHPSAEVLSVLRRR